MKIFYSIFCPECKVLGVDKQIFFENGDFLCDAGHSYTSMEDIEGRTQNFPVEVLAEPVKKPAVVQEIRSIPEDREEDEREAEALKSMTMAPPPAEPVKVDLSGLQVESKPTAVAVAEIDTSIWRGGQPENLVHKTPGVRELPGDALEITVIIPDPHASFLRGEAAFRGKTVQEFFEETMMFGMDARWWY